MAKRVLTVACHIPGGFGDYVSFKSKASLLDADYVLFAPDLEEFITFDTTTHKGKPALTDDSSFSASRNIKSLAEGDKRCNCRRQNGLCNADRSSRSLRGNRREDIFRYRPKSAYH